MKRRAGNNNSLSPLKMLGVPSGRQSPADTAGIMSNHDGGTLSKVGATFHMIGDTLANLAQNNDLDQS